MVVIGGGEGALVDVVGQEAVQGILEGGEGRLVVRMQDGALMFVQMLQETGGGWGQTTGSELLVRPGETGTPSPRPQKLTTAWHWEAGASISCLCSICLMEPLVTLLEWRCYHYPHFTDEETPAQRGEVHPLKTQSQDARQSWESDTRA